MERSSQSVDKKKELPSEIMKGLEVWKDANATYGTSKWSRAQKAFRLREAFDAYNNQTPPPEKCIVWGSVAQQAGEDRCSLNDDVAAYSFLSEVGLKTEDVRPKSYSLFVKLKRRRDQVLRVVEKSSLQPAEMEKLRDSIRKTIESDAKSGAIKDSPVRMKDVEAKLDAMLVKAGVLEKEEVSEAAPCQAKVKVEVRSFGIFDSERFVELLQQEFQAPTYRGIEVGVVSATIETLDDAGIAAAFDKLKETIPSNIPPRGEVWIRLQRELPKAEGPKAEVA